MAASLVGGRLRLVAPMLYGYISKLMTHVFDMESLTTLISQFLSHFRRDFDFIL